MTPVIEPDPGKGQVVVTRFECPSVWAVLAVRLMHIRVKRAVRRHATGFAGITLIIDWRRRTVLSISLWQDLESVYTMGQVTQHIHATRIPSKLGITTSCGIFCYAGEWMRVMFGASRVTRSPLHPPVS
jgi:hypothetical protein